jgi:hypothetical protein
MLRFLLRAIGLFLLAGGFIALIVDGTRSLAGSGLYVASIDASLQTIAPAIYQSLEKTVLAHLPNFVWDPLIVHLLRVPVSAALLLLGGLCVILTHKDPQEFGYPAE